MKNTIFVWSDLFPDYNDRLNHMSYYVQVISIENICADLELIPIE